MKDEHEAGWAKNELFRRIFSMKAARAAADARDAAKASAIAAATAAAAPAQPHSTELPPSVKAAPAQPAAPKPTNVISLQDVALKAGYYIPSGRGQSIDNEFPLDPVTANWRRTLDQKPREFPPDTLDVTNADAVERAFQTQVRIAKEKS
jgi:subtilisin family serine protease